MKYVHPFPARMAPEIAIHAISQLKEDSVVLDPMTGSGVVLLHAAKNGLDSIGYDVDPLACLIAKVGASRVYEVPVMRHATRIYEQCLNAGRQWFPLDWIDSDGDTKAFVKYWYGRKQERQLRALAHLLMYDTQIPTSCRRLLQVALSRLIITKEPKASLARDTAHSRPHKVTHRSSYDVFDGFISSVTYVINTIKRYDIARSTRVYNGDARRMNKTRDSTVDLIVTSPPYFNAIDYLRGHRLSLVWLGYQIHALRRTRSNSIGSENVGDLNLVSELAGLSKLIDLDLLTKRESRMVSKYFFDLKKQLKESIRVLKPNAAAIYVIGNSRIRGNEVKNNELLKVAARDCGFVIDSECAREIPNNKRYLPVPENSTSNAFGARMKMEFVIGLRKPKN